MKKFILLCLALCLFIFSVESLSSSQKDKRTRRLEEAIQRGCIECYAIEGRYPDSIEYLEEHYGIQIGDGYIVHFESIASNLMPDFTVLEME